MRMHDVHSLRKDWIAAGFLWTHLFADSNHLLGNPGTALEGSIQRNW